MATLQQEFEQQIKANELLIFKVCRIYAHNPDDRQDLYQDILVQLWKAYPSFQGRSKFTTWMYRVAVYTAIAGIRKRQNALKTVDTEGVVETVADEGAYQEKEEQLKQLYKAIAQLNEIDKAIVMLYLDNRSYEEMEEILGIPNGTLRVKMNRIREKLKQHTKQ